MLRVAEGNPLALVEPPKTPGLTLQPAGSLGWLPLPRDEAAGGDGVFRQLVLARINESAGKIGSFEPTQAVNVGSAACAS
jgi:hypothetical protein